VGLGYNPAQSGLLVMPQAIAMSLKLTMRAMGIQLLGLNMLFGWALILMALHARSAPANALA
jgi:hypothetical protein